MVDKKVLMADERKLCRDACVGVGVVRTVHMVGAYQTYRNVCMVCILIDRVLHIRIDGGSVVPR